MFEIREWCQGRGNYYLKDEEGKFLHSDGNVYANAAEYWPTQEFAQVVLDKYQPKHVWEHGDVFKAIFGPHFIYLSFETKPPQVVGLNKVISGPATNIDRCLDGATFLFNIREKIQ